MRLILTLLLTAFTTSTWAQSPGDIAIVGMNADNPDRFAFVALAPLSGGTVIHFTDNGWRSDGTFRANEGLFTYTVPGAALAAGDVVEVGTPADMAFATSGDQILAYTGDATSPAFIYALNASGQATWQDSATSANTSALPAGLVNGSTAVAVAEFDNVAYNGPTTGTQSELLAAIGDPQNWQGSDSAPQTFVSSFTVSDAGANRPPVFSTRLTNQSVIAGTEFVFDYVATDPDGDTVTYNIFSGPGAIDATTGRYTWTPASADIGGRFDVVIRAVDGQAFALTSATLDVIAEGSNSPPRFTAYVRGARAIVGQTQTLAFSAEDDQNDTLSFSIVEGPPGSTIEPVGEGEALLSYTPSEIGVARFVVRVSDGEVGGFDELVVGLAGVASSAAEGLFPELAGVELRQAVDDAYSPNRTLGYTDGRDTLYARVETLSGSLASSAENRFVRGVYTNFAALLVPGEDPSTYLFDRGLNAEHLWPQSLGAADEPQRSDMHILYPSRVAVNSDRGNLPFGEVSQGEVRRWYNGGSIRSETPTTGNLSSWSRLGDSRFEPNDGIKGDIARAIFYFWTMYPDAVNQAFFEDQVVTLLGWNEQDPPSGVEVGRSARIQHYQGNANPFILDTSLMERMWNQSTDAEEVRVHPEAIRLEVYPNPAAQHATLSIGLATPIPSMQVDVFDLLGRHVRSVQHPALEAGVHRLRLDVNGLAPGYYALRAVVGGEQRALPLIIAETQR